MHNSEDKSFDPDDLPEKGPFKKREIYQYKQPADTGAPLEDPGENDPSIEPGKEAQKTSKEEGLNQEKSTGTAGAFEGFEARREI